MTTRKPTLMKAKIIRDMIKQVGGPDRFAKGMDVSLSTVRRWSKAGVWIGNVPRKKSKRVARRKKKVS